MASEEMRKVRSEITQQAIKDHQLAVTGGTGTDQFKCGKCGKRNTTYNQVSYCIHVVFTAMTEELGMKLAAPFSHF